MLADTSRVQEQLPPYPTWLPLQLLPALPASLRANIVSSMVERLPAFLFAFTSSDSVCAHKRVLARQSHACCLQNNCLFQPAAFAEHVALRHNIVHADQDHSTVIDLIKTSSASSSSNVFKITDTATASIHPTTFKVLVSLVCQHGCPKKLRVDRL